MSETKEQTSVEGGGNLEVMQILESIGGPESPSGEPGEPDNQPTQETVKPDETSQGEESWLIKDKFRDSSEGREALTKAYRELQSEKDKVSSKIETQAAELEPLRRIDAFMRENPDFVQGLKEKVERDAKGLAPPEKPDDYDIFDESVEDSPSHKWRQEHDEYLVRRGSSQAMEKLEEFKVDIARSEQLVKENQELRDTHGLSDEEIGGYRQFLADPDNVNHANAVKLWRMSLGNDVAGSPQAEGAEDQTKRKQVSAAAVSGSSPKPARASDKETQDALDGIMQFNRS